MGALVNRAQLASVREGLQQLKTQTEVLYDGTNTTLVDADPSLSCCIGPTLLGAKNAVHADSASLIHEMEVFGPVATLVPYRNLNHAYSLIRRGQGSLVASIYGSDAALLGDAAIELADSHGRIHAISPDVGAIHTGHGNVMPHSLHGGPGRAGGGEELGGVRALNFYHRRSAIQASTALLDRYQ
jgi:3,4-dehydroadipyl-CoA semialdehyde dehydrogenase